MNMNYVHVRTGVGSSDLMITVYVLAVAAAIMQCHFSLTVLFLVLLKKIQGL